MLRLLLGGRLLEGGEGGGEVGHVEDVLGDIEVEWSPRLTSLRLLLLILLLLLLLLKTLSLLLLLLTVGLVVLLVLVPAVVGHHGK